MKTKNKKETENFKIKLKKYSKKKRFYLNTILIAVFKKSLFVDLACLQKAHSFVIFKLNEARVNVTRSTCNDNLLLSKVSDLTFLPTFC